MTVVQSGRPSGQANNFRAFRDGLESDFGARTSPGLFASLELAVWNEQEVVLSTGDPSAAEFIVRRYGVDVRRAWERRFGPVSRFEVIGANALRHTSFDGVQTNNLGKFDVRAPAHKPLIENNFEHIADPIEPTMDARVRSVLGKPVLRPSKTLERFCVNETNRIARHAVMRLLDGTGSPVTYIYSANGRGKTHLLNAVALEWLKRHPAGRLMYLHYDTLVADVSDACITNGIKELKEHLQDTDILILDDAHLLRGRKRTQEELGCLIERLTQAGKIVLIAGAISPALMAETGLCPRLTDRLTGGVAVELKSPDYELRLRIANQWAATFAEKLGHLVPQRQIDLVAWRCDASVRELEGALQRFELEMDSSNGALSDEAVRAMLNEVTAARVPETTLEALFDYTIDVCGVTRAELRGVGRKQALVRARHAFCLASRKLTDSPLAAIGAMICRDHTTVMNSIKKAEIISETDSVFADRLSRILDRFERR